MRLSTHWPTITIYFIVLFLARPVYMGRLSQMKKTMGSIPVPVADNPWAAMFIDPLMVEFRANMTEVPQYGLDSRPDWAPQGWDLEKVMDMTAEEWRGLAERQQDVLRAGLEAHCGTEFKNEVLGDMSARSNPEPPTEPPSSAPNFLSVLHRYARTGDWGFVFYRTSYAHDDETWSVIKEKLNTVIESTFDYYKNIDGITEAKQRWKLLWIEDAETFNGMAPEKLAEHYRGTMEKLPANYQHSMLFAVDEASARSILLADATDAEKMQKRPRLGDVIPFVLAMDDDLGLDEEATTPAEAGEEEDSPADERDDEDDLQNWHGPFRAHPASLVDEIYTTVASQSMQMYEFAYAAHGNDDVWWDSYGGVWTLDDEGRYAERLFESAAQLRVEYREKKNAIRVSESGEL